MHIQQFIKHRCWHVPFTALNKNARCPEKSAGCGFIKNIEILPMLESSKISDSRELMGMKHVSLYFQKRFKEYYKSGTQYKNHTRLLKK